MTLNNQASHMFQILKTFADELVQPGYHCYSDHSDPMWEHLLCISFPITWTSYSECNLRITAWCSEELHHGPCSGPCMNGTQNWSPNTNQNKQYFVSGHPHVNIDQETRFSFCAFDHYFLPNIFLKPGLIAERKSRLFNQGSQNFCFPTFVGIAMA